ncbi:MAG: VCBS repeat-containing protein, partial [Myxococcota bacterium]
VGAGRLRADLGLDLMAVGGTLASVPTIKLLGLTSISTRFGVFNIFETLSGPVISATYATTAVQLVGLDVGDLDRDGDADILVAFDMGASGTELVVYRQNSDGTYTELPTGDLVSQGGVNSVALSDVDQDGRLDAVVSLDDAYSTSIEVLYQDRASATPSFVADHSFVASGHETNFGIPADMDRNGRPDFVTIELNNQSARILPAR